MDTSAYDAVPGDTEIHMATVHEDGPEKRIEHERRLKYSDLKGEILLAMTDIAGDTHESHSAQMRAIRQLWQFSCHKLLTKIDHVRDFHPAALLGHLGLCRIVVSVMDRHCDESPANEAHRVLVMALHLAWNLSAYVENKALLVQEGVVPVLCKIYEVSLRYEHMLSVHRGISPDPAALAFHYQRTVHRCCSAVLQNVSEKYFKHGETNPVQLRIVAEGGLDTLVGLSALPPWAMLPAEHHKGGAHFNRKAAALGTAAKEDISVQILALMGVCNLSLHPANRASFLRCGALELLHTLVNSRLLFDAEATGDAFEGWLSMIPLVPLLSSKDEAVAAFGLQCLACAATQGDKYLGKLWKDLALVEGVEPLRRLTRLAGASAVDPPGDSVPASSSSASVQPETAAERVILEQWRAQGAGAAAKVANELDKLLQEYRAAVAAGEPPPPWTASCSARVAHYILFRLHATPGDLSVATPPSTLAPDLGRLIGVQNGEFTATSPPALRGLFSDISIEVGDPSTSSTGGYEVFAAHKAILAARIPLLLAQFTSDIGTGANTGRMVLPDVHPQGFRVLLEWAYTGSIGGVWTFPSPSPSSSVSLGTHPGTAMPMDEGQALSSSHQNSAEQGAEQARHSSMGSTVMSPDTLVHGLVVSDRFDVPLLRSLLEECCSQGVDEDNAEAVLEIATMHRAWALADHCRQFMRQSLRLQAVLAGARGNAEAQLNATLVRLQAQRSRAAEGQAAGLEGLPEVTEDEMRAMLQQLLGDEELADEDVQAMDRGQLLARVQQLVEGRVADLQHHIQNAEREEDGDGEGQ